MGAERGGERSGLAKNVELDVRTLTEIRKGNAERDVRGVGRIKQDWGKNAVLSGEHSWGDNGERGFTECQEVKGELGVELRQSIHGGRGQGEIGAKGVR